MRSMTEGLLHGKETTPQPPFGGSSPCTGEPKNIFHFSFFTSSLGGVPMQYTADVGVIGAGHAGIELSLIHI